MKQEIRWALISTDIHWHIQINCISFIPEVFFVCLRVGIHPNASRWLVKNRKIKLIGVDTASIDYGQSTLYESHQILYERNIPGLENVAHMDKLPIKGFTLYATPMFITGGSGGSCRIFARLDKEDYTVNAAIKDDELWSAKQVYAN